MKSSDLIIVWRKDLEDNRLESLPWDDAKIGCIPADIAHSDADQRKIAPY